MYAIAIIRYRKPLEEVRSTPTLTAPIFRD